MRLGSFGVGRAIKKRLWAGTSVDDANRRNASSVRKAHGHPRVLSDILGDSKFGDWARINGPIQERTTGIHVTIILLTQ